MPRNNSKKKWIARPKVEVSSQSTYVSNVLASAGTFDPEVAAIWCNFPEAEMIESLYLLKKENRLESGILVQYLSYAIRNNGVSRKLVEDLCQPFRVPPAADDASFIALRQMTAKKMHFLKSGVAGKQWVPSKKLPSLIKANKMKARTVERASFNHIPEDLLKIIFSRLPHYDLIYTARSVCRIWRSVADKLMVTLPRRITLSSSPVKNLFFTRQLPVGHVTHLNLSHCTELKSLADFLSSPSSDSLRSLDLSRCDALQETEFQLLPVSLRALSLAFHPKSWSNPPYTSVDNNFSHELARLNCSGFRKGAPPFAQLSTRLRSLILALPFISKKQFKATNFQNELQVMLGQNTCLRSLNINNRYFQYFGNFHTHHGIRSLSAVCKPPGILRGCMPRTFPPMTGLRHLECMISDIDSLASQGLMHLRSAKIYRDTCTTSFSACDYEHTGRVLSDMSTLLKLPTTLRSLTLRGCMLISPVELSHWLSLHTLTLCQVHITDNSVATCIAHMPLLTSLELVRIGQLLDVTIVHAKLLTLRINGCPKLQKVTVNTPLLKHFNCSANQALRKLCATCPLLITYRHIQKKRAALLQVTLGAKSLKSAKMSLNVWKSPQLAQELRTAAHVEIIEPFKGYLRWQNRYSVRRRVAEGAKASKGVIK